MNTVLLLDLLPDDEPECIGKTYRYLESGYIGSRGDINLVRRLVPLKRISCPGCSRCDYVTEDIHEGLCNTGIAYPEIDPKLKSGDMAEAVFVPDSWDWESGVLDGWHIRFDKYVEP